MTFNKVYQTLANLLRPLIEKVELDIQVRDGRISPSDDNPNNDSFNGLFDSQGPEDIVEMPGCCGIVVLDGVSRIADEVPTNAYKALGQAMAFEQLGNKKAAIVATTIPSQKQAIAFFRAAGFTEIPVGKGGGSSPITLWVLGNIQPTTKR